MKCKEWRAFEAARCPETRIPESKCTCPRCIAVAKSDGGDQDDEETCGSTGFPVDECLCPGCKEAKGMES
jgi:hypothetical protein